MEAFPGAQSFHFSRLLLLVYDGDKMTMPITVQEICLKIFKKKKHFTLSQ